MCTGAHISMLAVIKNHVNMRLISTNELFHFTEYQYLKSIISKKAFYPRFNIEITLLNPNLEKKASIFPIPMVCFCDIPLDLNKEHRKRYGNCGIALNDNWKTKKKLNPVFYIKSESYLADTLSNLSTSVDKLLPFLASQNTELTLELNELRNNFITFINYIKTYENKKPVSFDFGLGKIHQEKRKFYDEKEWRYIPEHSENNKELELSMHDFKISNLLLKANKKLENQKFELSFESSDVDFLIVNSSAEKNELKSIIDEVFNDDIEIIIR
jgi:hypothetical protein